MKVKKKVLITGGSRGLGRAIALKLSEEYDVTSCSRGKVSENLTSIYPIKHISGIDVLKNEDLEKIDFSEFDILINNAGISYDGYLVKQDFNKIEILIQTNITSVINITKRYIQSRLNINLSGNILNISSIVSKRGYRGIAVYSATKAAINGFTIALAKEMANKGFRINAILPGYVQTSMLKNLSQDQIDSLSKATPLQRLATPQEIANAVEFIISDKAQFITGQLITVDGGFTI